MFVILNEKFLLEQIKSGNKRSFDTLFAEYYEPLCRYARSILNDHDKAEDVVQQLMLNIWEKREILDIKTSISSYLHRACFYEAIKYKQKHQHLSPLEEATLEAYQEVSGEDEDYERKLKYVNLQIDKLPAKCREIFLLNKLHQLKYREIAQKLQLSERTVEAQLRIAMTKLKKAFENYQ